MGGAYGCQQNAFPADLARAATQCNGAFLVGGNACQVISGGDASFTWNTDGAQVNVPQEVQDAAWSYLQRSGATGGQPKAVNVRDATGRAWSLIAIYSQSGNVYFSGTSYTTVFVVLCTAIPQVQTVTVRHLPRSSNVVRIRPLPKPKRSDVLLRNAVLSGAEAMMTYKVQAGDTPVSIAGHLAGDPRRMRELVLANPHKRWAPTGLQGLGALTFSDLTVGETLQLPASWGVGQLVGDGSCPGGQTPNADGSCPGTDVTGSGDTSGGGGGGSSDGGGGITGGGAGNATDSSGNTYGAGGQLTQCWDGSTPVNGQCPSNPSQQYNPTPGGQGGGPTPQPPRPSGGGGGGPPPPAPPDQTASSSWLRWIIGAAAIAAGVGAMMYFTRRRPGAAPSMAPPQGPRLLHPAHHHAPAHHAARRTTHRTRHATRRLAAKRRRR